MQLQQVAPILFIFCENIHVLQNWFHLQRKRVSNMVF